MRAAARILVSGVVQGIGFRPAVYRTAVLHGITGVVRNMSRGVEILAYGDPQDLSRFRAAITVLNLPGIRIDRIDTVGADALEVPPADFQIEPSVRTDDGSTEVPPDQATCRMCLEDWRSDSVRRGGHPLVACTACGPRYTMIKEVPYSRVNTTMWPFPRCEKCLADYGDSSCRRFNFEGDTCWGCSPSMATIDFSTSTCRLMRGAVPSACWEEAITRGLRSAVTCRAGPEAMAEAAETIRMQLGAGKIVALKSVGGYQLLVNAMDGDAVMRLRRRKGRPVKPFVVMFPSMESLREYCRVSAAQAALLRGGEAPIVLLPLREGKNFPHPVCGDSDEVGALLPYSGLHHHVIAAPTVVTSANRSENPIVYLDEDALTILPSLCDFAWLHDRAIICGVDDSVVACGSDGGALMFRRARGYAPSSITIPSSAQQIFAVGGDLKNTFAFARGEHLFVSQHNGDLENTSAREFFWRNFEHLSRLTGTRPDIVVCDLHPAYASVEMASDWAEQHQRPRIGVQHHLAHALSVVAEHGLREPCIAAVLDGTGYGLDGSAWGGEILRIDPPDFERVSHLEYFQLIGGDFGVRNPLCQVASIEERLDEVCRSELDTSFDETALGSRLYRESSYGKQSTQLKRIIEKRLGTVACNSTGRLFDMAAAVLLGHGVAEYEAQPAIALEAAARRALHAHGLGQREGDDVLDAMALRKPLCEVLHRAVDTARRQSGGGTVRGVDVLAAAVVEAERQKDRDVGALFFHVALAEALGDALIDHAIRFGIRSVVVSGGCFQNRILASCVRSKIQRGGLVFYRSQRFPPNDACIAVGQAIIGLWVASGKVSARPARDGSLDFVVQY